MEVLRSSRQIKIWADDDFAHSNGTWKKVARDRTLDNAGPLLSNVTGPQTPTNDGRFERRKKARPLMIEEWE